MESLTKEELIRVRKVNELKEKASKSRDAVLAYFPGANLVLIQKHPFTGKWLLLDQTGRWFEGDYWIEQ